MYFYNVRKKKNIVVENITIEDYAAEGKSLTRQNGKVLFIEGAVPGDVIDVQLTKNKKDWAEGYPLHFHSYSHDRVEPFCQHFGVCGGCQWQMLPYEKQLQYKQKQVWDNLTRIGKISLPQMLPIAGAKNDKFYRNKLEYTFSTKEFTASPVPPPVEGEQNGTLIRTTTLNNKNVQNSPSTGEAGFIGFHAKGFFEKVVDIQKCWLQPEPTNAIRNSIRTFAKERRLTFYDIRHHVGFLRTMQVRICRTGEIMVNIVFGEQDEQKIRQVLDFVQHRFPQITTLLYTINLKKNDSLHDLEPQTYSGKGYVVEKLENFQFKIGPKSFFQTNTEQAERLYQITRDFAELKGHQVVYDLYCGTGSIGIFCSRDARKIIGVEAMEAAVQDARQNAAMNQVQHAQFFTGNVIDICSDTFFTGHGRPDVLITDPPRAGMHQKLVEKILAIEAPTVVYVSCNPATQARDLALLDQKYSVTKLQPVDMFPHTHHIENVAQLKLKNAD
ncbi:MAG: 23S rRNA (uracil(1939)-C(5))-methyltransferase RlmD [Flavisolibacter sp.]|nr:23S rRNA (uracil(1939)-C(5))-methyltransferase RlmD [Flavisolibacter sp.]